MNAKDVKQQAKDVKNQVERTLREVKQDLDKSEFFRNLHPAWVLIAGLVLIAWIVSGAPALIFSASMGLVLLAALGLVLLGPPLWVLTDARKRGVKHPLGWGIFALLTTPVGALIYYLIRPDAALRSHCSGCGKEVSVEFPACPYCGEAQPQPRGTCPACQSRVDPDWRFCPYCRHEMHTG
jgi:hypothetical protein